jgi:DNA-binding NarL/FixJ family response regulator
MSEGTIHPATQPPIRLVLMGYDPIFQVGLRSLLEQDGAVQVVGAALTPAQLWPVLGSLATLDAVVVDLDSTTVTLAERVKFCRTLKTRYPQVPVLAVAGQLDRLALDQIRQCGIEGYWPKGSNIDPLQRVLRVLMNGTIAWPTALPQSATISRPNTSQGHGSLSVNLRQNSLQAIQVRRECLGQWLEDNSLSWWQWVVLTGQMRELNTAQQLIEALFPAPSAPTWIQSETELATPSPTLAVALGSIETIASGELASPEAFSTMKSIILDRLAAKLALPLHNHTETPLEIDILQPNKKQELCLTVLKQFETLLDELRFSNISRSQLQQQRSQLLQDLWQGSTTEFLGKYRTIAMPQAPSGSVEVVKQVLQDVSIVDHALLSRVPMFTELVDHLLFHTPLVTDQQVYPVGSSESIFKSELLLNHLVVQVANAVMQPLINRFSTVDLLRRNFFDRRWLSTREIERFRNALSWKYRVQQWFMEPKDIFESQYRLLVLSDIGIQYRTIHALRDHELKALSGIPFVITLALEARDAVAPPLQATATILGRGFVYLLTQIIGRSIGLVGRGILQGVGYVRGEVRSRPPQSIDREYR